MKVKVKIKNFLLLVIHIALTIICMLGLNGRLNESSLDASYEFVFIVSIIFFVWMLYSWKVIFKPFFNFYTIFMIAAYLFYFGQYLVYFFVGDFDYTFTILNTYDYKSINNAAYITLNSMLMVHAGIIISSLWSKSTDDHKKIKINIAKLQQLSALYLIITIIPAIYFLVKDIKLTLLFGYGNYTESMIQNTGFSNLFGFIASYVSSAIILSFIAFKGSKWNKLVHIIFAVYILLYFISGKRLSAILIIAIYLLIKYYYYKRFTLKDFTKYAIVGAVTILIITVIPTVRTMVSRTDDISSLIKTAAEDVLENGPITTLLKATGVTLIVNATVFNDTPSVVPYNYGLSYLNNVFMLIPNLFWDVHPGASSNTDIIFSGSLTRYGGIGSSFIAEAYFNFGSLSILLMPIFGLFLYYLSNQTKIASNRNDILKLFLMLYISSFVLFYIRSDIFSFSRNLIYKGIVPLIFIKYFTQKRSYIS